MATPEDFRTWFSDFGKRFPAVAEYAAKHDQDGALLRSWCETLTAFDAGTLHAVTTHIVRGALSPVDNFKLGTFADEIRQRARSVVEWNRHQRQRKELHAMPAREPIAGDGRMAHMLCCAVACDQILSELTGRPADGSTRRYTSHGSVRPDVPYDAAIILADDHGDGEGQQAQQTLADAGIGWQEIEARAELVRRSGVSLFHKVGEEA